jgi:hypothetical protein
MNAPQPVLQRGCIIKAPQVSDRLLISDALNYNDYLALVLFDPDVQFFPSLLLREGDMLGSPHNEEEGPEIGRVALSAMKMIRGGMVAGSPPSVRQGIAKPTVVDRICIRLFSLMTEIGYVKHDLGVFINVIILYSKPL